MLAASSIEKPGHESQDGGSAIEHVCRPNSVYSTKRTEKRDKLSSIGFHEVIQLSLNKVFLAVAEELKERNVCRLSKFGERQKIFPQQISTR